MLQDTTETHAAQRRLQVIRYALRCKKWWLVRQLLAEAEAADDWRALGFPSVAAYSDYALQTHDALSGPRL